MNKTSKKKTGDEETVEINISALLKWVRKYSLIEIALLLGVAGLAYYIRILPNISFLQAIDPYYIYRTTLYIVENSFSLYVIDSMRYYPDGFPLWRDYYVLFYMYAFIYTFFFKIFGIDFLTFAQKIPALLGALYVVIIYFISKEVFGDKYRWSGIFAGILFATSNATLFRSSEGFFEKEPISGLFILLSVYMFIKGIKHKKILDGALSGVFSAFAYALWGGAVMLPLLFVSYVFIRVVLGRWSAEDSKFYVPFAFFYTVTYSLLYANKGMGYVLNNIYTILVVLSALGVVVLYGIDRYFKLKEDDKVFYYPLVVSLGIFSALILSLFVPLMSRIVSSVMRVLVYRKQVIESTVAENIPATVDYFLRTFGIVRFNNWLDYVFSLWFLYFISLFVIIWKYIKNPTYRYVLFVVNILNVIAYFSFLKSSGENTTANVLYIVLSAITIGMFIKERRDVHALLLLFAYATLMSFVVKVRISYPAGMFMSIVAAFILGYGAYYLFKNISYLFPEKVTSKSALRGVVMVVAIMYVLSFIYFNVSFSSSISKSLGVGGENSPLWKEALTFLRTNTSQDAVILSWWDFGYWFQTIGNRTTLLDGGNQKSYRNVFAAKYFTGRYNYTWDLLYLKVFEPTHILLDYTMIGKYAAMSKIANNGKWIDVYAQLRFRGQEGNYLVYQSPAYNIYVPITGNGTLDVSKDIRIMPLNLNVNPTLVGAIALKYLCTPRGVIDMSLFKGNNSGVQYVEECIYIFPGAPNIAFMTYTHPNNKAGNKIFEGNFHKLYLEDGSRIPYVRKVFDNVYVKIYEVNYTFVDQELKRLGIDEDYVKKVREICLDSIKTSQGECVLYYDAIDLS